MRKKSEAEKIYRRNLYAMQVAHGICTRCTKVPAQEGFTRCEACRMREKEATPQERTPARMEQHKICAKRLYWSRKASGLCVACGDDSDGKARCPGCRAKIRHSRGIAVAA